MDGNGRIGRLLMNTMLASGGYSWTVIPVERRTEYFAALDAASVEEDIVPLTTFLATCLMASEAYAEQTTETVCVTAARAEGLATDTGSTESIRSE
jgi:Fic family protein